MCEAVKIGLLAVIGYSLYIDILFTDSLRDKYMEYISSPRKNMFFLAGLITLFVLGFKILDNLVLPMDCSS
jgi:preprotein translocase subunit SecF